jgi:catechol 2,3-dioxygenase-like lactoylglutathione lyase family enzyme
MAAPLEYEFHHIHIFCSDLAATERWFVELLGAELVERRDSRGVPSALLRLGGAPLMLRPQREGENLAAPLTVPHFGADHFGLAVADVDATIEELRRRGVTIDVEPYQFTPTSRIAYVRGPDGVRIEFVQARR